MKHLATLVVSVLALTIAFPTCAPALSLEPGAERPVDQGPSLLFLEIPRAGAHELLLEVDYSIDDSIVFTEILTVRKQQTPSSHQESLPVAIELLAWHPEVASSLQAEARDGARVSINVVFEDGETMNLPLDLVITSTQRLRAHGCLVVGTESEVIFEEALTRATGDGKPNAGFVEMAIYGPDPQCSSDCDYDLYWCMSDCGNCTCQPDECEARCEYYYERCIDQCPVVCLGPSHEDHTTSAIVSWTYFGPSQCRYFLLQPTLMEYGRQRVKYTTTRVTSYCDGSTSSQVISVQYQNYDCWLPSGYCPSGASGNAYNVCPIVP